MFGRGYEVVPLPDIPLHAQLFPQGARLLQVSEEDAQTIPTSARRQFWLDLVPRPIMAAGGMVDLLVRTNVGHYIDFRALDAVFVEFGGDEGLQCVPGSRSDVFQNRFISMLEKRLLMRFVKKCYGDLVTTQPERRIEQLSAVSSSGVARSFQDEMSAMGLTDKLCQFLTHSIAFCSGREAAVSKEEGVTAVQLYQKSMAKFGTKTPMLYANYGSGELSQAFCRLCAVHGGVYVLRRGAVAIVRKSRMRATTDSDKLNTTEGRGRKVGIFTTQNELIACDHLFLASNVVQGLEEGGTGEGGLHEGGIFWRLIAIISGSVIRESDMKRVMLTVPRGKIGNDSSAVRVRQLDSSVMVCPRGYFVFYAETVEASGNEDDILSVLEHYVESGDQRNGMESGHVAPELSTQDDSHEPNHTAQAPSSLAEVKPRLLWGMTYSSAGTSRVAAAGDEIFVVPGPDCDHDADIVISNAKECFQNVCEGETFFAISTTKQETDHDSQNGFHEAPEKESDSS